MDILKLIESEIRCLRKFLLCSQKFLASSQTDNLEEINLLQDERENILKAISLYNRNISHAASQISHENRTPELLQQLRNCMAIKTQLVQEIIKVDEEIIAKIHQEKARLQKELKVSDKASQLVKKFKSQWIAESGEKLDGTL